MLNQSLETIFPKLPEDMLQQGLVPQALDLERLPEHVAIIMDGNGRWAKARGKNRLTGHKAGANSLREVIRCANDLGIKYLTAYSFSTENWNRPKDEVMGLMDLFASTIIAEMDELHANNAQIKIVGDISVLPKKTREAFDAATEMMKNNTGITLLPAVNYGSRTEILRAVKNIVNDGIKPEDIDEEIFENYLYTNGVPAPDLVIRTSGEMRISNFLLWQIAYSEFYVTDTLWPDFDRYQFLKALLANQNRNRRFGGVENV